MAASKTKLARALSAAELEDLCERLAREKNLTGKRIQEIAAELGVEIGHSSAAEFKNKEFEPYLERLRKRRQMAEFIAEKSAPEDVTTIADAAAGELSQLVFEMLMASDDKIDLTTPDGRKAANNLSLIIARIRQGDHRLRKLESDLAVLQAEKDAAAKVIESAEGQKGVSDEFIGNLRQAFNMRPPEKK
jgi:hypothetical protein